MKIYVCVKQVPDTSGKVAVNPDGTLNRASMQTITNPDDKRTAPDDAPAYYHPPVKAIREAAERIREGRMEYAAEALTRRSDPEEPRRP